MILPFIILPKTGSLYSCLSLSGQKYDGQENRMIDIQREEDGRWIAEVLDLPGVMVYGDSREEAITKVKVLGLRVLADRREHGEETPQPWDLLE
jgi:predicted RNase H-like HicB family nuclease